MEKQNSGASSATRRGLLWIIIVRLFSEDNSTCASTLRAGCAESVPRAVASVAPLMKARSLPLAVLISLLTSVGWRCNEVIVPGHLALPLVRRTAKDQFIFAGLQGARGYHQGDEPPPVGLLRGQSSLSPY